MDGLGLPKRIQILFNTFLEHPQTRSHLLLIGPPGSGKTTSARFLVEAIHGKNAGSSLFGRALFLNSSDERGLEAVRSRVYPFVRSSFQALFPVNDAPKMIVFDEAETLTDQAQIALRPLLDELTKSIIIIFLCNSISRSHPSIVHKFMVIPFEAPKFSDFKHRMAMITKNEEANGISGLDVEFRRGDIRFFILNPKKYNECTKLWHELLTCQNSQLNSLFTATLQKWTYPDLAMFCIYCCKTLGLLRTTPLIEILRITDTDFIKMIGMKERSYLLSKWFQTFVKEKLEAWPPPLKE
jgi:hypothetical protein